MSKKQKHPPAATKNKPWLSFLLIALVSVGIYSNTFDHGYVLDDISVISENRYVTQGLAGLGDIWSSSYRDGYWNDSGTLYRPMVQSVFALQWTLAPNNPGFAHVMNVLLYALLCMVLFVLIKRLTENATTALFAALIFAAITVHTEVVANIKSLDEILSLLLGLSAWYWIIRDTDTPKTSYLVWAALCFTAGMFTKEGLIAFVAVIPISLWFFRSKSPQAWLRGGIPLLSGVVVYLTARIAVLGGITASLTPSAIDNPIVGYDLTTQWLTGFKLIGLYLQKLLYPSPLRYEYAFNAIAEGGLGDPMILFGLALAVGMLILVFKGWKGRSFWAFIALYFAATMVLYSNTVVMIGAMFAERFVFFGSIAFAWVLAMLIKKIKQVNLQYGIVVVLILVYGGMSYARNPAWKSSYDLYAADMDNLQESCKAHYNYGLETMKVKALNAPNPALREKHLNEAMASFERALQIKPNYQLAKGQIALVYYRLGNHPEAIRRYTEVLEKNPNDDAGWNNLAGSYVATQQYEQALECYQKAIALNRYFVDALGNAGAVNGMLGRHEQAIVFLKQAAALAPNNASYQQYLGLSYQALGQNAEAQAYFNRARQLQ